MSLWDMILETNTFNFVILLIILAVLYHVLHISQMLENLKNSIITSIENAKFEQANARNRLKDAQTNYDRLGDEIKAREEETIMKSNAIKSKILQDADFKIDAINKNAINMIAAEEKTINAKLTERTLKASIKLAKEIIINKLKENPELHNKFIDESIGEL